MEEIEFELESRMEGVGPIFVGSYQPGDKIVQWDIVAGNQVSLKCDGVTVIADVTEANKEGYKGSIIGFENHIDEYLHGKRKIMDSHKLNIRA